MEKQEKIISFIVSLSFFIETMDSTVINTAIPVMSQSLHVNPVDLKLALISYLLSLAIFIPISGWIADKFGIKKVFMCGLLIFTLSSLWCGFSQSLTELVIARAIQGLGGALGMPIGRLIILKTFGSHKLVTEMGRVVMVGALGMMLGPVLGGFITHYFSWQWIFWINLPVGAYAIFLAKRWLHDSPPIPVPKLDMLGFILFGAGLAGFTFGASALSETNINFFYSLLITAISFALLICYAWHSRRRKNPVIKTDLFKLHTFKLTIIGSLISRIGFSGMPFMLPLLMQIAFGYSPQLSGLLLAPTAIGVLLIKPFALPLLRFFGYKKLLLLNTTFVVLSLWVFTIVTIATPIYLIAIFTFLFGFAASLQFSALNSLAYSDVSATNQSAANSMVSTVQQISQSIGIAICALLLRFFSRGEHFQLTTTVFHHTFFTIGLITFTAILIFAQMKVDDGEEMLKEPLTAG